MDERNGYGIRGRLFFMKNKHRKDRLGNTRTVEMTPDPEFIRPGNAVRLLNLNYFAGVADEFAADDMTYHAQIRGGAPVKMMSGENKQPIVAIGVASSPDKAADNAIESFNAGFLTLSQFEIGALNRVPRKKTFNRYRVRARSPFLR